MDSFYSLLKNKGYRFQAVLGSSYFVQPEMEVYWIEQESEFQEFLIWIRQKYHLEAWQLQGSITLSSYADIKLLSDLFQKFKDENRSLTENKSGIEQEKESEIDEETGWDVFLSLGENAPEGKLQDTSVNHDRYLYGKE